MSAVRWPDHLLTLDEWDSLTDDDTYRWAELVEGVLQMAPAPSSRHQVASGQLCAQLNAVLPDAGLFAVQDVEVLVREEFPPVVRIPDLSVMTLADVRSAPRRFRSEQVLLAVEIVSPGSRRVDRIMKRADYADAGIPHYWIIELDDEVRLDAYALRAGRYEQTQSVTGTITLTDPVPLTLDLTALVP